MSALFTADSFMIPSTSLRFDLMSLAMMFLAPFYALWGFLSAMLGFGGRAAAVTSNATSTSTSSAPNMRTEQTRVARYDCELCVSKMCPERSFSQNHFDCNIIFIHLGPGTTRWRGTSPGSDERTTATTRTPLGTATPRNSSSKMKSFTHLAGGGLC